MPLIPFPDVPNLPGVPALARVSASLQVSLPSLTSILLPLTAQLNDAVLGQTVWGIFDQDGNQALFPDAFIGIDFRNDARVSNYPQEQGAFASYNKVQTPYDCRVRLAIGSDAASRTGFLDTLDAMLRGIDLYTVVSPEMSYPSATLQNYDYRRDSSNGVTMLTVDLDFIEVRVTATANESEINTPQNPASADAVSDGQVQSTPVTQSSITAVNLPPLAARSGPAPTKSTGGATGSWDTSNTPKPVSTGGATGSW
jgi:hypothetical protein